MNMDSFIEDVQEELDALTDITRGSRISVRDFMPEIREGFEYDLSVSIVADGIVDLAKMRGV